MHASAHLIDDVFQWDVLNWSKALPLWRQYLPLGPDLVALTVGEREGGLSLWLATHGVRVTCTDVVEFPPATRALHERHHVPELITYEQADATALRYPDDAFDIVMFKSVLGDLTTKPRQQRAVDEFRRVLRPRGLLMFAENLTATRLHHILRKRFVRWNANWRYLDLIKDQDLFESFASFDWRAHGFLGLLGRTERQRRFLGRIDGVLSKVVPPSSRYILVGVCRK